MYLYICVDPWEVGEPGLCRVRRCGKQRGVCRRGVQPLKSCPDLLDRFPLANP